MTTTPKPWKFTANGDDLEIRLFSEIGANAWTGEGTSAAAFADELKAAGDVRNVRLLVNSPGGGSVFRNFDL